MAFRAQESLEELFQELYDSQDVAVAEDIAKKILVLDPDNPEALFVLADGAEEYEAQAALLRRCVEETKRRMAQASPEEAESLEDLLFEAMRNLGWSLLLDEKAGEALALAEEMLAFDGWDPSWGRGIRFGGLLAQGKFAETLEESLKAESGDLFAAHARAVATLELAGPGADAYRAVWDAFRVAPDLPFFVLEYWDAPEEEDEEFLDDYNGALFLQLYWTESEERIMVLSTATVFFGYLTDRLPDEVKEEVLANLRESPMFAELERARVELRERFGPDGDMEQMDKDALKILAKMDLFVD